MIRKNTAKPTVAYQKTMMYLESKQAESIRKIAYKRKVSASSLIREAVGDWLKKQKLTGAR